MLPRCSALFLLGDSVQRACASASPTLNLISNPDLNTQLIGMQVGVRVEEENMGTGARAHCCSAYLTFVAVSADGSGALAACRSRSCPAPPIDPALPPNVPQTDAGCAGSRTTAVQHHQ